MPPKRSAEVLRALADDPLLGWIQTPLAKELPSKNSLSAPYLSAYFYTHDMPVSRQQVDSSNGDRLWNAKKAWLLEGTYQGSELYPTGIEALSKAFNHGFRAPLAAQDRLLTFLRSLPGDDYQLAVKNLQDHYALCRRYRSSSLELSDPPSYLDLFKNDRVAKTWSLEGGVERVLVSANDILMAWPELMQEGWNEAHAARDASSIWESCRQEVDALHKEILEEG
jgi:hypothetical protein